MPQRLKSRSKQIPNGMYFRQPEIVWDSRKVLSLHPSFDTLVRAVISARKANPHHAAKHKWATDFDTVANEVETFQVKVCLAAGWTAYLTDGGGAAPPFSRAQSLENQKQLGAAVEKIRKLWTGVKTVSEWLTSNSPAVPPELSEARAQHCFKCPYNNTGNISELFVATAQAAIKNQLQKLQERNLKTSFDDKIGVCSQKDGNGGCLCLLPLAVHIPIELKLKHLSPESKSSLHPDCWVRSEEKALQVQA